MKKRRPTETKAPFQIRHIKDVAHPSISIFRLNNEGPYGIIIDRSMTVFIDEIPQLIVELQAAQDTFKKEYMMRQQYASLLGISLEKTARIPIEAIQRTIEKLEKP